MTGIDKARETRDKIAGEVSNEKAEEIFAPVAVERHDHVVPNRHYSTIKGLEEVSTDIIPLPFYKLVQPGSTNIKINEDGEDATPGQFYQADSGTATDILRVGIVRAKRQIKVYDGEKTVSIGFLGVNLETMTPFLMSMSQSSFSNFGRMMNNLGQRKIDAIWKCPIVLSSIKQEKQKLIKGEMKMTKFWIFDFTLEEKLFNEEELSIMQTVLAEYAGTLDRNQTDEEGMPF